MNRKLAIAFFFLLVGLPLVLFALGHRGEMIENRAARTVTQPTWQNLRSGKWFASVNDYLIDHTPLRQHAIYFAATLDQQLFGTIDNARVSVGKDDWMFYNGALDHACVPAERIETLLRNLATIAQRYQTQHNTRILWVIAPNKAAIYPEHLTSVQTRRATCATANRAVIRRVLQDPALAPYVLGLWDTLEAAKGDTPLYFRSDSHWNHKGATLGMEAMFERFWPNVYRGEIRPADTAITFKGDLANMLGTATNPEQETEYTTQRDDVQGGVSETSLCIKQGTPRLRSFRHHSNAAPMIREKVVILRDSYFDTPLKLVPPYFAQLDTGHLDHTPVADWPAIAACADTLVIETVERSLLGRATEFGRIMQPE